MMRTALGEEAETLRTVSAERVGHCRRHVEHASPVARLVLVNLHATLAGRHDGAEGAAVEDLAQGEAAGARVLEDERGAARQGPMGADELARLDVLVRARQMLAGQMVAWIAE